MVDFIKEFEKKQIIKLSEIRRLPHFRVGDTIKVNVKIIEGANERIQAQEGLCIAKSNKGLGSNFTIRKISHGEGVERTFPLHSSRIVGVEVVKKSKIRRAKLYYIRELRGKAARLKESMEDLPPAE
ncbi:MAG: 50S ribosomal protein L19 [Rickettsiales bacterium]|nr:50S ribosomal protein L19 [Rickettsiales bacterium]